MNKKIRKRIAEIEARKTEIAQLRENGGLTSEQLDGFITEVRGLNDELRQMRELHERDVQLREVVAEGRAGGNLDNVLSRFSSANGQGNDDADNDPYSTISYRRAFMNYVLRGTPIPAEQRAGEVTHTTDVGSVIPSPVLNQIIQKMESSGMILPLIARKAHKGGMRIPTSSVKPVAKWVGEGKGSDRQKKPTGELVFAYYKLRCLVAVTLEVDTMSLPVFEAQLIADVVEAMVIALEEAIINGSGVGQPSGILRSTPAEGQLLEIQSPSHDDLVEAFAAVPTAYEKNIRWCMTKKTFMAYYGLKDDNGQPIGRVDHGISGTPERTLLGIPVTICDYIATYSSDLVAGTCFAFLFNFKDYVLNTNLNMSIERQKNWETDDMETKAVMVADGQVIDENSLVKLVKAA